MCAVVAVEGSSVVLTATSWQVLGSCCCILAGTESWPATAVCVVRHAIHCIARRKRSLQRCQRLTYSLSIPL